MKLVDIDMLVGNDSLFAKRGCPGNCQHCNLWSKEGCRVILEAPTVEIVHGRNLKEDWPSLFECSICNWSCSDTYYGDTGNYNYCPNCGAKMDL